MCTLSWQLYPDHLNLVFNRDEVWSKPAADPPQAEQYNGVSFIAPIDTAAGGSWILGNCFGVVVALLNNYEASRAGTGTEEEPISRGQLVMKMAAVKSVREAANILDCEPLSAYQPFNLLVFKGISHPHQWQWDGSELVEIIAPSSPVISSSLHPKLVKRFRRAAFRRAGGDDGRPMSPEKQLAIHKSRWALLPAWSVAMRRKDRATVSITQVRIEADRVTMKYQPCDPVTSESPLVIRNLSLWNANGKEDRRATKPAGKTVDYRQLMLEKNWQLHDSLPEIVFPIIRKAGMQKTVNRLLRQFRSVEPQNFPQTVLNHLRVHGKVQSGSGRMPVNDARPLFVANHPTGGLDGLLMLSWLMQYYPSVKMVVTDLLDVIPQLRPYIIPVDLYDRSRNSVSALHEVFAGGNPLLIFPAGRTGRKRNGRVRDAPWNKMPIRLAQRYNRTIVPVYIDSSNSWKFNLLARIRQFLGISLNPEMLLLPREFLKPARKEFRLYAGKALKPQQLTELAETDAERVRVLQSIHEQLAREFA